MTIKEHLQPSYNLKAVVQETGIKPDTLRAWERRYGLPKPVRTTGGHRLYTQADIDTLKWLICRQEEGLSISRAVDLWNQYVNDDKDPFVELPSDATPPTPKVTVGNTLQGFQNAWYEACMSYDEQGAEHTISQALSMYPPEVVCIEILQRGISRIGVDWYEGKATAQQEHFASSLAMRRVESLVLGTPPPTRLGRILIGCAPEEEHTFSAILVTLLLRRKGFEALYLGANVPLARLEATIAAAEPRLVILTAQTLPTAATLLAMAELLRKENVPLAFGGLIFNILPSLKKRIPGYFLGDTLEEVPARIEQLYSSIQAPAPAIYANQEYQDALQHFLEKQAKIESIVWELMEGMPILMSYLARANRDLARCIIAALTLGDIELIGKDIHWIEGLLMNYHYRMPKEALYTYMKAYHQASTETLDDRGTIIGNWLELLLEEA